MITVLGVDQSMTCTGVVVLDHIPHATDGQGITSIEALKAIRTSKTDAEDFVVDTYERARTIGMQLVQLAETHKPDYVVFETPSLASKGNATRTLPMLLGSLLAQLEGTLSREGVTLLTVAPTSLKKFATGKGNATKDEMVEAIESHDSELYQLLMNTAKAKGRYDVADAYWLAKWAIDKET